MRARSLDRAFIGTIHAFCAHLLRRRPVEAGVDPVFQELAEPDAMRVFARVFRRWLEQRLASPSSAMVRALARLAWREERDLAEPVDALRNAAWDLAKWRDFDAPWDKRGFDRDARLYAMMDQAEATLALRDRGRARDPLFEGLRPLAEFVERARRARDAGQYDADVVESELLRLPREVKWLKQGAASTARERRAKPSTRPWQRLLESIAEFGRSADADLAAHLRDDLWEVVRAVSDREASRGAARFHGPPALRPRPAPPRWRARGSAALAPARVCRRIPGHDPLQTEVLLLLAAADPAERDWRKAAPAPGKLYVVATRSNRSIASAAPMRICSGACAAASPMPAPGRAN